MITEQTNEIKDDDLALGYIPIENYEYGYDDVVGDDDNDDDDVGAIKKPNRLKLVPRGESEPS